MRIVVHHLLEMNNPQEYFLVARAAKPQTILPFTLQQNIMEQCLSPSVGHDNLIYAQGPLK